MRGSMDDAEYSYIDCNVVGAEAEKLIRRSQAAVEAGKKVLGSFRIGDIWTDAFTYEKGGKKGQPGASLKGRLLADCCRWSPIGIDISLNSTSKFKSRCLCGRQC